MNQMNPAASQFEIPLANPALDLAHEFDQILEAVATVLKSGRYILGPLVGEFETGMAQRLGVPATVGVASGTDALVLSLRALGIGRGDEVVTVSHTAGPTVAAIRMLDATPVLIDIEPNTYCLDASKLEPSLSPLTKAIIAVHLYGHPAEMDGICGLANQYKIPVVEDCAQAQAAKIRDRSVGSIGDFGCFSFYPTKNLGAIGDGGLVAARDIELTDRVRRLREYGWTKPQYAELAGGCCSRLDELQAAVLLVKLRSLVDAVDKRRVIALRYNEAFQGLPLTIPTERKACRHAYHLYVVRCDRRDALAAYLNARGIATGLHYPYPVHRQPAFSECVRIPEPLLTTEKVASEILTLPLFPSLIADQQARVIDAVSEFFGRG